MIINTDLLIFIGILWITIYFLSKRRQLSAVGGSYKYISAGLVLLSVSGFLDTLFLGSEALIHVLDDTTWTNAVLNLVAYPPALFLIVLGLRQWLPALFRLDQEIRRREAAELAARRRAVELMEASLQADLANRAKGRFLAHMSHELRTPLTAILGFSELLQLAPFGPLGDRRYAGYADDIHRSGSHLLHLVNDVLDLSKVDAGLEELHEERFSLEGLVDETERLFLPGFRKADLTLHANRNGRRSDLMYDRSKLSRILINLLGNAMKFTAAGGEVWLETHARQGGTLAIVVRDSGVGMTGDQVEVALTPFGQADNRIRQENQGSGLGLPIVKSLCELHGGRLEIASSPGQGTTVTILVPAHRVLPPRAADAAA